MTFPSGTVLAEQARTTLDQIYIVRSGRLELFFESRGEKSLRHALEPGDIFGGISILMNAGLAIRSLKVISDASLYALPAHVFLDLCRRYSPFQAFFIAAFNQRMEDESYGAAIAASQVVYFLSKIIPFSFLNDEEVKAIAPMVTAVHHAKDTLVFVQGESRVDGLYIVQKGAAERYFEQNQRKTLHSILAEGEMSGGISMLVNDMLAVRTLRHHRRYHVLQAAPPGVLRPVPTVRSLQRIFHRHLRQTHAGPHLCGRHRQERAHPSRRPVSFQPAGEGGLQPRPVDLQRRRHRPNESMRTMTTSLNSRCQGCQSIEEQELRGMCQNETIPVTTSNLCT